MKTKHTHQDLACEAYSKKGHAVESICISNTKHRKYRQMDNNNNNDTLFSVNSYNNISNHSHVLHQCCSASFGINIGLSCLTYFLGAFFKKKKKRVTVWCMSNVMDEAAGMTSKSSSKTIPEPLI